MPSPLDHMRDLLGVGIEEIPGATVAGEIPVSDAIVNRFVAKALANSQAPVSAVRIETFDDDRLAARVAIRGPKIIPEVNVFIEIERQPELPQSPVLRLKWSLPGMGPLAMIAAPFLSNLKNLPPGIRIDGDHAVVDVAELLRSKGMADMLSLLTRLEVHTRAGRAVLRFDART